MTLDKVIVHLMIEASKRMSEYRFGENEPNYYQLQCKKMADEYTQVAEWLKELEVYKKNEKIEKNEFVCARNKTIDDFVKNTIAEFTKFNELHGYPTVGDCEDILKKVVERLKAGESSEKQ